MNTYLHDRSTRPNGKKNLPRWGALLGGSALALYGISRRSKSGAALAAAGGLLVYGGSRISSQPAEIHAEASFTVNVPPEDTTVPDCSEPSTRLLGTSRMPAWTLVIPS